jgi:hypothetical protein
LKAQLEGALLWALIAVGAAAGAVAFAVDRNWLGFAFFAAATVLASTQLVRIRLRGQGAKGRRW